MAGIGGLRMLSPVWSSTVEQMIVFNIQQVQTADIHSMQLAHFFKPNIDTINAPHTRVFGYEHFLKHGSGPAKKGMGFLFCFTSKKKCFPLTIPNISPVVPRFLCLKLCKTLGRRVLVSPILK